MVMVVNMTTYRNTGREDNSCILNVGDHPKVTRKSWIKYSESEELLINKLLDDRLNKLIDFEEDISDELLQRIQDGAKKSLYLPRKFYKYFNFF